MRRAALFTVMVAAPLIASAIVLGGERTARADGPVVDSILPPRESLRRFQAGLSPVSELQNAASSVGELMRALETALRRDDAPALAALELTRAEYAYLYFPSSIYASEPYDLPPEIAWMLHTAESEKGLRRLVRRVAGEDFLLDTHSCAIETSMGANRLFQNCTVTYRSHGNYVTRRLFGSIIDRDGRFKIFSYSNDF